MNEVETRDLIFEEVRRYVSPKTFIVLIVLNCLLLIFSLAMFSWNQTQQAWIDVLNGDVQSLKSANRMATEISQLRVTLETMMKKLESEPELEE